MSGNNGEGINGEMVAPSADIQNRIYALRGLQVMLDRDLAAFYEVKPVRLREQVKRNSNRFPSDFMFRLTDEEVGIMVSQNAIPSRQHLGGYNPYAFTEEGVAAISSVLTGERAVGVSIQIMRAFVAMRRFISSNALIFQRLDTLEIRQSDTERRLEQVMNALESGDAKPRQGIFFDGQVYDAHLFVTNVFRSAETSIIIIDNYLDDSVLTHLTKRKKNVRVTLLTRNISRSLLQDVERCNEQYPPIEIREFANAHDRFIIIDDMNIYHLGASLKDLGKRWFAFSVLDVGSAELLTKLGVGK